MRVNSKYKKHVLKTVTAAIAIGFVVLAVVPSSGIIYRSGSSKGSKTIDDLEDDEVARLTDPATSFNYDGTEYLQKDKYPEINKLISDYYNATLTNDMGTLEGLVSDVNQVNQAKLQAQLEYMEGINNITCYTVAGETEGTYRVYVYYDLKIRGIKTSAPALSAFYVTMDSDGGYVVYLSELDGETQDFIADADTSTDVQTLKSLVNDRFKSVMAIDSQLQTFCSMLENNATDSGTSDVSGQALGADGQTEIPQTEIPQ